MNLIEPNSGNLIEYTRWRRERGCRDLSLQENSASFGVAVFGDLDNWSYPDCESFESSQMDT